MRIIAMVVVACCLQLQLAAQQLAFHLRIVKGENKEPVPGATLLLPDGRQVIAGARGWALLPAVDSSIFIQITAVGCKPLALQLQAADNNKEVVLQPVETQLSEIVVSGGMRASNALKSTIPVEQYGTAFFKSNPAGNLFDALAQVNGVQAQLTCNVCNTGELRINGLDGPYTLVLIDGMPIVSALSSVYGLMGIPAGIIKRVEVIKGPASTLYGSSAVAGIVNIITKEPTGRNRFSVDHFSNTYGEHTTDLGANFTAGRSATLLGVHHYRFNQRWDTNNDNFTDVSPAHRFSLFNKWSIFRKSGQPFSVAWRYFTEDRWGGELQWNKLHRGGDSIYGESIYTNRLEVMGQYGFTLAGESLLAEFSYNMHLQDAAYGNMPYIGRQSTAFAQVRWNRQWGRHHFLAGIPMSRIGYDDNTPATQTPQGYNNPAITTMAGTFVQHEFTAGSFTLQTGMRLEVTNVQRPVLAPRLGVRFEAAENQVLRLSAGNGFRIVNLFTEDHAALTGARTVVIRNTLRPERSWNANLNYSAHYHVGGGLLSVDANAFYTRFTNRIIPDYFTDPNLIIYDNLEGFAISRGIAVGLNWNNNKGLQLQAGATWMDVFVQEEKQRLPQLYAPRISGTYAAGYSVKPLRLRFDLTGRFVGPMYLPVLPNDFRPERSPFYQLLNLQATYKIRTKAEVYAAVQNLFNFMPTDPIMRPFDPFDRMVDDPVQNPFGYTFDPSYNYAPMMGRRLVLGMRLNM
ncbi:MAG: TonB-dependent receptor plug domain-containing protein [Lacibacter sp.]